MTDSKDPKQFWIKVTLPDGREMWDGPFDKSEVKPTMNFILGYLPEGTQVEVSHVKVV